MIEFVGDIEEMIKNYFIFPYFYEKIGKRHWRIKKYVIEAYYSDFYKELACYFTHSSAFFDGVMPYGTFRSKTYELTYLSFCFMPLKLQNFQISNWTFFIRDVLKNPLRCTIFFYVFYEKNLF